MSAWGAYAKRACCDPTGMSHRVITMRCTIPEGMQPGQQLTWQSPSGTLVAMTIPDGSVAGGVLEFPVPSAVLGPSGAGPGTLTTAGAVAAPLSPSSGRRCCHPRWLRPLVASTPLVAAWARTASKTALGITTTVTCALALVSILRTMLTEPGRIPPEWEVGELGSPPEMRQVPREHKHDGSIRICRKSRPNVYKPDRAHFCRILGRCVLKMDHFSPWLANAIGFANHKYFLLSCALRPCRPTEPRPRRAPPHSA